MKMHRWSLSQIVMVIIILATSGLLLLDSYGSSTTSAKLLVRPVAEWLTTILLVLTVARIHRSTDFNQPTSSWWLILGPWLLLVGLVVTISWYDFITPVNTLFAQTGLQQTNLGVLAIFTGCSWLLLQPNYWWQRWWQWVAALLPIPYLLVVGLLAMWPMNYLLENINETHFYEDTQFYVLLVGIGVLSIWLAKYWSKIQPLLFKAWLILMVVGIFLVAGDEISWGQTWFGFVTPAAIAEQNTQGDITWHNLDVFHTLMSVGYIVTGFGLGLARPVAKLLRLNNNLIALTPNWQWIPSFLILAVYNTVNYLATFSFDKALAEPIELLFYVALVGWLLETTHWRIRHSLVHNSVIQTQLN